MKLNEELRKKDNVLDDAKKEIDKMQKILPATPTTPFLQKEIERLNTVLHEKDDEVLNLKNTLRERDTEISRLKIILRDKDNEVLRQRDGEVQKLKSILHEKDNELSRQGVLLRDKNNEVFMLKHAIEEKDNQIWKLKYQSSFTVKPSQPPLTSRLCQRFCVISKPPKNANF